jgi:molecular chaperone GrpE
LAANLFKEITNKKNIRMMVKKKMFTELTDKENKETKTTEIKDNTNQSTEDATIKESAGGNKGTESKQSDTESDETSVPDKKPDEEKVLLEKLAEMQDRYLRLSAEFDNYRKRTLKEKIDISKYAGEDLLKDMLPVMDDFERALKFIETSDNCEGIKQGIDLIYSKLTNFLNRNGVKEIESLNTGFNVDLHDAAAKIPVADADKKGKIVEVLLKGYFLKDKVLRHSKVVVGE